jgi:hypothetical protein
MMGTRASPHRGSDGWAPLDAWLEATLSRVGRLRIEDPARAVLASHRVSAARSARERFADEAAALAHRVEARDAAAIERFDALCERAMADMRGARPEGHAGLRFAATLDRFLYSNREELLDDPNVPRATRVRLLDALDRFNTHLGSYAAWTALIEPLVHEARRRNNGAPARIVELAAGHGSFSIHLARHFGSAVRVVATDLRDEYLALGRAREDAAGVVFQTQDATDLASLQSEKVDVFVCTQSLHHFPPGMVTRMIGEAARSARVGLCFIDGERGVLPLMVVAPLLLAYGRSWALFHDGVVSLRRMYYEEELALCAGLAPGLGGANVEAGRQPPGFAFLRVRSP